MSLSDHRVESSHVSDRHTLNIVVLMEKLTNVVVTTVERPPQCAYWVFRWLGPFPTHDLDLWIRTSGEKRRFWAFGFGPRAKIVGKSQEKCKNKALGKMANVGPFSGPRMAISCQKRRPCFDNFPVISCVFFTFSHLTTPHNTHTHHTTRISLCFLWFSVF